MTIYFSHPTDSDAVIAVEIGVLTTIDLNYPDDDWDIATDPNIDENSYRLFYVDELEWVMQLPYVRGSRIEFAYYDADGKSSPIPCPLAPIDNQSEQEFYKRRIEVSTP